MIPSIIAVLDTQFNISRSAHRVLAAQPLVSPALRDALAVQIAVSPAIRQVLAPQIAITPALNALLEGVYETSSRIAAQVGALDGLTGTALMLRVTQSTRGWRIGTKPEGLVKAAGSPESLLELGRSAEAINTAVYAFRTEKEPEAEPWLIARSAETGSFLDWLESISPKLPLKYKGAWNAVSHRGPDWISQAASSGVELLDWTLRSLAPDMAVIEWQSEVGLYKQEIGSNGRPYRSLRVRYIAAGASALSYVAIFKTVRSLTSDFEGSNPTWVRRISPTRLAVALDADALDEKIVANRDTLIKRLSSEALPDGPSMLLTGSSRDLPLRSPSIDRVVTSPPYLTRIDYAVAYARELAVIGIDVFKDRKIRSALMGTTLIRPAGSSRTPMGAMAKDLVHRIATHRSYASGVYYLKQANQYFDDLTCSLDEITRVCAPGAFMTLVVQDSYYKDVPVRLGDICLDEAELRGWEYVAKKPFEVSRSLTTLNTSAKLYPKGKVSENVITEHERL